MLSKSKGNKKKKGFLFSHFFFNFPSYERVTVYSQKKNFNNKCKLVCCTTNPLFLYHFIYFHINIMCTVIKTVNRKNNGKNNKNL